jgi:hypothetical protein
LKEAYLEKKFFPKRCLSVFFSHRKTITIEKNDFFLKISFLAYFNELNARFGVVGKLRLQATTLMKTLLLGFQLEKKLCDNLAKNHHFLHHFF